MSKSYGQYCPLALSAELLCERWTLLVLSRVIEGCSTFSEIHRGVPRISPTMLTKRLSELEHSELVEKRQSPDGRSIRYSPTAAAMDLEQIINDLAIWGQRWARDMTLEDLDPAFLAWSMHLAMNVEQMPSERVVIEFRLSSEVTEEIEYFWIVHEHGNIEMCMKHPGFETDLSVASDLRLFVEAWRGFRNLRDEIGKGSITLDGPRAYREAFPNWLKLSMFSPYKRLQRGRERQLYEQSSAFDEHHAST
ncbi:MAG: helix-turn-helix transcriptional regulator [Rhodothermales bacterium]|nr:helix-turn-helix transcriptional regulator [Rhodothermales bacterium]